MSAFFFIKSYAIGVATKIDESVPIVIPSNNAKMKPRMVSPPNEKIAIKVTKVVTEVLIVRDKVEPIALLIFSRKLRLG